ncbi:SDR family oxidoreductase [Calothrix sp. PCC 6303]|uniref:SDR family oxidoreductase n=1 Tax=Calothrix sp. PCC 6303 TaxID=1170562 RepID=UPI0002A03562|nr:SDR family oxidoreductase [Calothrix sp. PCC 6303]AFZ01044.1 Retinol dehydrogenase [Calothrix sp. PCC 6303]
MVEQVQGTVVITGASTGIGEACALMLDKLGFSVFAGVRKESDAEALKQKASSRLTPIFLDVTDAESIQAAVKTVSQAVGNQGICGLVNNAGVVVPGPLELVGIADFHQQLLVNVTGQLAVTQAFLGLLRSHRGSDGASHPGRIVNMGSISGISPSPFTGAYNTSKFALEGMTDVLRMELKPWNISVSLIEPGAIATPIWSKSFVQSDVARATLSESAEHLYGAAMNSVRQRIEAIASGGISPNIVANAVVHALTAKKPKTRYLIGSDAKLGAFLKHILPDRLHDKLILFSMGL